MDWNDLRYFLAVARAHSLTEASRELRVSQATVARRIAALESSLKTTLFAKRPDGYVLSEAGEAFFPPAEAAEAQLLWLERGATGPSEQLTGIVRLAIPELLGQHLIIPGLAGFQQRYPQVQLEVIADVRPLRLSQREADVLVRLVRPTQGDYLVRRIGSIALGLYGSRAYVEAHGVPRTAADLEKHRLIGWDPVLAFLPLARWLSDIAPEPNFVFRAHTMGAQLVAAEASLGLAVLPAFIANRLGLVRVLESEPPFISDIWLLQQSESHALTRVRSLADHVAETITDAAPQLMNIAGPEAPVSSG
ncbi:MULTISPECIES: LysR family transcriptional regulator [unclassified Bradyrhizobium]|uniref:LysR family transcriptional regulator n=1 Tax=unclassified Bradyrhizobium TaxID=2631580 RepID=UPI0007C51A23|nr:MULTISPECIES: LysR family transcriptional regulator [unclassified Bradyrhizobium]MCP3467281.1 LysR family transcriptional regulator [Bradyrhizobium sp. CCGUVB23]